MLLAALGALGAPRLSAWADHELHAAVAAQLGALLGRPVTFDRLRLSVSGMVLEHARMPRRRAAEAHDPVVIEHIVVTADWWRLFTARRLHVSSVEFDHVTIVVPPDGVLVPAETRPTSFADQLRVLRAAGLERVRVHDSAVRASGWALEGVSGELALPGGAASDAFRACVRADGVAYGARALGAVPEACVHGEARDGGAVELATLRAHLAGGGTLAAHGTLSTPASRADATLAVHAADVPLATLRDDLAALVGPRVPAVARALDAARGWSATGTLASDLTVTVRHGALAQVSSALTLAAPALAHDRARVAFSTARARLDWTPDRLTVTDAQLGLDGATLAGDLVATAPPASAAPGPRATPAAPWRLATHGTLRIERRAAGTMRALLASLARSPARDAALDALHRVDLARATAAFDLAAPADSLAAATGTARLRADDVRVRGAVLAPGGQPLRLAHVAGTVARSLDSRGRPGGAVTVRDLQVSAHDASLVGELTLESEHGALDRVRASGRLRVRDLRSLRALAPRSPLWRWVAPHDEPGETPASAAVDFRAGATLRAGGEAWAEGRAEARGLRIGTGATQQVGLELLPFAVTRASAAFRARATLFTTRGAHRGVELASAPSLVLSELHGETSAGTVSQGSLTLDAARYHLALDGRGVNAQVVHRLVPGTLQGGHGDVTLALDGALAGGDPTVAGRFDVRDVRYALPRGLPYDPGAVRIARMTGAFRVNGAHVALDQLALSSDVFTGNGAVAIDGARVRVQARLSTRDLGRAARGWAPLAGVLRGGTGSGVLDLASGPRGITGTLALDGGAATLVLPGMAGEFATHPVARAHVNLLFTPERVSFTGLTLRGPRGNVDARGESTNQGVLSVRGRAWLTEAATAQLLAPTGFGWLARLFGVRSLGSDFTLRGDARGDARLDAAIAHTTAWHLLGPFIPRPIKDVARGRTPVWGPAAAAPPAALATRASPPAAPRAIVAPAPVPRPVVTPAVTRAMPRSLPVAAVTLAAPRG